MEMGEGRVLLPRQQREVKEAETAGKKLECAPIQTITCGKYTTNKLQTVVEKRGSTQPFEIPTLQTAVCSSKNLKASTTVLTDYSGINTAQQRSAHTRTETIEYMNGGKAYWRILVDTQGKSKKFGKSTFYQRLKSVIEKPNNLSLCGTPTDNENEDIFGMAYIFNQNIFVKKGLEERVGTNKDAELLKEALKSFRIDAEIIQDATRADIENKVEHISEQNFSENSCIIIAILSHGRENNIINAFDDDYNFHDVILSKILYNQTLKDKPIICFIQTSKSSVESSDPAPLRPDGKVTPDRTIIFQSNFQGYEANSHERGAGSLFIASLCNILQQHGHGNHIEAIMKMVLKDVEQKSEGKQIPTITSGMPHKFFLYK